MGFEQVFARWDVFSYSENYLVTVIYDPLNIFNMAPSVRDLPLEVKKERTERGLCFNYEQLFCSLTFTFAEFE